MIEHSNTLAVTKSQRSICEILRSLNKISRLDLERGLEVQKKSGQKIGRILIDLGIIPEEDLRDALGILFEMPTWEMKDGDEYPVADFLPVNFMLTNKVLLVEIKEDLLTYAIADPQDNYLIEILRSNTEKCVKILVGTEKEITFALDTVYKVDDENDEDDFGDLRGGGGGGLDDDIEHLRDMASEAPVIRLVSSILTTAVELGTSDIHMEIFEKKTSLRYRIDGVLRDYPPPSADLYAAVISRIKIMAKLNIAEKRLPQDGRILLKVAGKEIDLRVSIIPMNFGEGIVLRILDRSSISLELETLGFSGHVLKDFREMANRSNGIILVTGPTGSGKTTTLYGILKEKVSPDLKIITVEDPIEYGLEGVNQIQVNAQIKLTFAAGLRSILRHDPDVILIGEIRDKETAAIAIQSALTGHLVFSTLHTNDAASSFTRLMDMGIENYLISSSVIGVLAQRLVRKLCLACREVYKPEQGSDVSATIDGQMDLINKHLSIKEKKQCVYTSVDDITIYKAKEKGCKLCSFSGYKGRMCISEFLVVDNKIRELINAKVDSSVIAEEAVNRGTTTLWRNGIEKVVEGLTTMDELLRVADTETGDIND